MNIHFQATWYIVCTAVLGGLVPGSLFHLEIKLCFDKGNQKKPDASGS
jgi:hypothetical protein